MTVTELRIALSASVLILSSGAALSDNAPAGSTRLASLQTACPATAGETARVPLDRFSTTARHNNVIRVRTVAAHAMPPKRPDTLVVEASCHSSLSGAGTALD